MKFNQQLADELGLTHWRLRNHSETEADNSEKEPVSLCAEEEQLLVNILKSVNINYDAALVRIADDVVKFQVNSGLTLNFSNVELEDTLSNLNLSSLKDMNQNPGLKKKTWFKLKNRFL